jgi:hypothetical protein
MMRSITIQYRACAAPIKSKRRFKSPAIIKVRFPVSQTFCGQITALSRPLMGEMWQIVCGVSFAHRSKPNPGSRRRNAASSKNAIRPFPARPSPLFSKKEVRQPNGDTLMSSAQFNQ